MKKYQKLFHTYWNTYLVHHVHLHDSPHEKMDVSEGSLATWDGTTTEGFGRDKYIPNYGWLEIVCFQVKVHYRQLLAEQEPPMKYYGGLHDAKRITIIQLRPAIQRTSTRSETRCITPDLCSVLDVYCNEK